MALSLLSSRPYVALSRADRDDIGPAAGSTDDAACGPVSYRSRIASRLNHPCVLARESRVVKPKDADQLLLVTGTRTCVALREGQRAALAGRRTPAARSPARSRTPWMPAARSGASLQICHGGVGFARMPIRVSEPSRVEPRDT